MSSQDITYCADAVNCPAKDNCQRADWPKDLTKACLTDFWEANDAKDLGECEYFLCNCSQMTWVGSTCHGNYYACPICGESGEG